jgi:predicted nucleotidyltransferase
MDIPSKYKAALESCVGTLKSNLGENLYSCILYGSAVRGGFVPKVSDLNVLIILNDSTPQAHSVIASAISSGVAIDPFVFTRRGMERSFEAFAVKLMSIKRDYEVLAGADPLAELKIDEDKVRFLCDQAIRNLRLRTVHAFIILKKDKKRYAQFLVNSTSTLVISLSNVLRSAGTEVPPSFNDRIPVLEQEFAHNMSVLRELIAFKAKPRGLAPSEIDRIHADLFSVLDHVVKWLESK